MPANLRSNSIGEEGAIALAKKVALLTQLMSLPVDLGSNSIDKAGAIALAEKAALLTQHTSSLGAARGVARRP